MKITAKFGGTSLSDAKAFDRAAKIVAADPARKYITVSAPGKRYADDTKITDLLYSAYGNGELSPVFDRFYALVRDLSLKTDLDAEYRAVKSAMASHCGRDFVASRGEYLSAKIFAQYVDYPFTDAADVIFFDEDGNVDYNRTKSRFSAVLSACEKTVLPGFYGTSADGTVRTFPRGGSDITGAITAACSHSDIYENWTDVDGVLSADPKTIDNPAFLDIITYSELKYLSAFGAGVLHEDALLPVRDLGIPIHIRNTEKPDGIGTKIVAARNTPRDFTGISGKGGFAGISISKDKIGRNRADLREISELFCRKKINITLAAAESDSLFIVAEKEYFSCRTEMILNEICQIVMPSGISYNDSIAVICAAGDDFAGITAKASLAMHDAKIKPLLISAGNGGGYVMICINENQKDDAVRKIYAYLTT